MKKFITTALAVFGTVWGYSQYLPLTGGTLSGQLIINVPPNNGGTVNIRPSAGHHGYITFTENAVADRWAIGVSPSDGNFYWRVPYPTSTPAMVLGTNGNLNLSGSVTGTSAVFNGNIETSNGVGNYVRLGGTGTSTSYLKAYETHFTAGNTYSGGSFGLVAGNAERVTIASNGNATFTGAINLNKQSISKGLNLAEYDTYASMRVISNAETSGVNADGMWIGYNNGNNGVTRLFGGGSTSQSIILNGTTVSLLHPLTGTSATFNGNVGIGTGSPQGKLDIFNDSNTATMPLLSIRSDFHTPGNFGMIRFGDYTQTSMYQKGAIIYESVAGSARGKFHIALENTDGGGSVGLSDSKLTVLSNGQVGIGTTTPSEMLSVNGKIRAREIKVETINWPDYVFHTSYKLPDLKATEQFIKENKHLPEIPSAADVAEDGVNLGEMNAKLLKKIEELTLYLIILDKKVEEQQQEIKLLKNK